MGQASGLFWVFAHPLIYIAVNLTVFVTLFRSHIEIGGAIRDDYEVFVLSGMIPWLLVSDVVGRAGSVMRDGRSLVRHGANIPNELIPFAALLAQAVPFLVQVGLLAGWVAASASMPAKAWIMLAGALVVTGVTLAGLTLILAPLGARWRGTNELIRIYCLVGIYLCPVFYTGEQMPAPLRLIMTANPATLLVELFRDALFFRHAQQPATWAIAAGFAVLALGVGRVVFARSAPRLADYL